MMLKFSGLVLCPVLVLCALMDEGSFRCSLYLNTLYLTAKYSVFSTLTHGAKTVCTRPKLHNKEIHHLRRVLTKCKYAKWPLDMA